MKTYDGRVSGFGITLAFRENEEVWRDKKVRHVIFPKHDIAPRDLREYTINELNEEIINKYNLHNLIKKG